ncbi:hypothetical protein ACA910_009845 [Epithemia clementina (nom. ined.)]
MKFVCAATILTALVALSMGGEGATLVPTIQPSHLVCSGEPSRPVIHRSPNATSVPTVASIPAPVSVPTGIPTSNAGTTTGPTSIPAPFSVSTGIPTANAGTTRGPTDSPTSNLQAPTACDCSTGGQSTRSPTKSPLAMQGTSGGLLDPILSPLKCPHVSFDFDHLDWGMWIRDQFKYTHGLTIEAQAKASALGFTPDISGKVNLEWGALRVFDTYRPKGSLGGSELCCSGSSSTNAACLFGNNSNTDDGDEFLGSPKRDCPQSIIQSITGIATDPLGQLWRSPGECKGDKTYTAGSNQTWEYCYPKGKVLVIQESDKLCPDDTGDGGLIKITFAHPVKLQKLLLLDIDLSIVNGVTALDATGSILTSTVLTKAGIGSTLLNLGFGLTTTVETTVSSLLNASLDLHASVDIGLANVKTVLLELGGSGSLGKLEYEYCPPVEPVYNNCPIGWWLLQHFSLITVADLFSLASVGGRVFVGGRIETEAVFEAGIELLNFTASPTLYVAGGIASNENILNGTIKVSQGGIAHPGFANYLYNSKHFIRRREIQMLHAHGSLHAQSDLITLAAKYQVQLEQVSDYLAKLPNQVAVRVDASANLILTVQSLNNGCAVFSIRGDVLASGSVRKIIFDKGAYQWHGIDLIVINVEGTSVRWDAAASIDLTSAWFSATVGVNITLGFSSGASKIIWNFPQATALNFAHTMVGTTLAPRADLTVSADIYGGVFVKSVLGLCLGNACRIRLPSLKAKCPFGATANMLDGSLVLPSLYLDLDVVATFSESNLIGGWTRGIVGLNSDSKLVTNELYCPGSDKSCWRLRLEGGINAQMYKEFDDLGDATTYKVTFDFLATGMDGTDKFNIQTQCTNYYPGISLSAGASISAAVSHADFLVNRDFQNLVLSSNNEVIVRVPRGCQKMKIIFDCIGNKQSETLYLDNIQVVKINYASVSLETFVDAALNIWKGYTGSTYSQLVTANASIALQSGVPCWKISGNNGLSSALYANFDGGIFAGLAKVAVVFDFRTTGFVAGDFFQLGYQCSVYDTNSGTYISLSSNIFWELTWAASSNTQVLGSDVRVIADGKLYLDEVVELTLNIGTCDRLQLRFVNHGDVDMQTKYTVIGNVEVLSPSFTGSVDVEAMNPLNLSTDGNTECDCSSNHPTDAPSSTPLVPEPESVLESVLDVLLPPPPLCPSLLSFDFEQLDWGMWLLDQFKYTHGITIEAKAKASALGFTPDISGKVKLEWGALRVFDTYRPKGSLGGSELCCSGSSSTNVSCLLGNNLKIDDGDSFLGSPKRGCSKDIIQSITGIATDPLGQLWKSPGECKGNKTYTAGSNQTMEYCYPKGKVLVIQESDKLCPDDTGDGGLIKITFTEPVKLKNILLLDIDLSIANGVTALDVNGAILSSTMLTQAASTISPLLNLGFGLTSTVTSAVTTTVSSLLNATVNLHASVDVGLTNVKTVLLELGGSGSLGKLEYEYCPPVEPVYNNCPIGWWLLQHFSLITVADLFSLASVGGRVFVGGRIETEAVFEAGIELLNFTASPTLYVAGGIASNENILNGTIKVSQGGIAHPGFANYLYNSKHFIRRREIQMLHAHGSLHAQSDLITLAAKYQVQLEQVSNYLAKLPNQVAVRVDASANLILTVQSLNNGCAVFSIRGDVLASGSVRKIIFDKGAYQWREIDLIVINVEGTSVRWDAAASIDLTSAWFSATVGVNITLGFNSGASKIIWNFPQATALNFAHTMVGTTLAPRADLTVSADIYGGVFVKSVLGLCLGNACRIRLPSLKAKCPFGATANVLDGSLVLPSLYLDLDVVATFSDSNSNGGWLPGVAGLLDSTRVYDLYCPGLDKNCWRIRRYGGINSQVYKVFEVSGDATTYKVTFDFLAKGMDSSDVLKIQTQCTSYYPGISLSTAAAITTPVSHAEFRLGTNFQNLVTNFKNEVVVRVPRGCQKMKIIFECDGNDFDDTVFLDNIQVSQLNFESVSLETFDAALSVWTGDSATYSQRVTSSASIVLQSGKPCWKISGNNDWLSTMYANFDRGIFAQVTKLAVVFDFRTTGFVAGNFFRLGYQCGIYNAGTGSYDMGISSNVRWIKKWEVGANAQAGIDVRAIANGKLYLDEVVDLTIDGGACDRLQLRFENHGDINSQAKFTVVGNVEVLYHY